MEFAEHGAYGGAMLDFLGEVGCDAWVIGNHEFDRGFDNAAAFVLASPVPVLSANLRDPAEPERPALPGSVPSVVLDANGLRVGVFGLTTPQLPRLASPATMARMQVWPPEVAARAQVEALEGQVDLVVALTHMGIDDDRLLAEAVPGIDLIVGGHSHTSLVPPERVGGTWIVQAGSYARQLGVLDLRVVDGQIVDFDDRLLDLLPAARPGPVPEELALLVDRWDTRVGERFDRPIGALPGPLGREGADGSPLGRFVASALRADAGAHVGITNRGGLRADLPGGPLTLRDLYGVLPFGNEMVRFDATGDELVGLALRMAARRLGGREASLELDGLRFAWKETLGSPEIVWATVGGAPLDPAALYTVATSDFLIQQSAHHFGFAPRNPQPLGTTDLAAAERVIRAGSVRPVAEPSVLRVDR
jgi:2',3'-cyclic-nucleotide 2'-phosphodiesterase (5'-nucleotidase family)